ncbi:MAG TPA: Uma2 family endonuclease [Cyclobacteriaceae bacterium]
MDTATIDNSKVWIVKDYEQLEEGILAQLIKGELIMSPAPVPQHQRILRNLFIQLDKSLSTGELYFSSIDLYLDNQNIYQPDLLFVSEDNKNIITVKGIEGVLDLIV